MEKTEVLWKSNEVSYHIFFVVENFKVMLQIADNLALHILALY